MDQENKMAGGMCRCGCHFGGRGLLGILVALIGLVFFLGALGVLTSGFVGIAWPIILILIGVKMMARMCKCCSDSGK